VGTLYEKYIDLTTGALTEQVSAYTTTLTHTPTLGRAWLAWKFAQGTHTLSDMQAMA
jgi:hypothetical protein